jgi:cell division protein FtsI (penicillin-binding protein 3)
MRRLMRAAVTEGSAKGADIPGYFVGGKTGTAQKTGPRGGYLENKRIAAFVGAFPMNSPRYAIYVMVDEPKPNARSHGFATAGWVAAPAAGMVIRSVAPILGMMPETERMAEIQASIHIPLQPGRPAAPTSRPAGTSPPRQTPPTSPPAPGTPVARPAEPAIPTAAPPRAASAPAQSAPRQEARIAPR